MGIDESPRSTGESTPSSPPKTPLRPVYLLVFVAVIAAVAFWRWRSSGFAWNVFAGQLQSADPLWLTLALTLALASYAGRAIRWGIMLPASGTRPSFYSLFSSTAIGFTATVFFGRAGEFVRPYLIARKARRPVASQLAVWFIERLLDLIMVVLIFGFALSKLDSGLGLTNPKVFTLLRAGGWALLVSGSLFAIPMLLFLLAPDWSERRLSDSVGFLPDALATRVRGFVRSFVDGMGSARTKRGGFLLLSLSIVEWIDIVACGYAVFHAFPATRNLSATDVVITLGIITIGNVVQIPGIGGGMQIAAIFALTEVYGVALEGATGVALALWAVNFLVIVPFGLVFAFRDGLNWHKLRHLEPNSETMPVEP